MRRRIAIIIVLLLLPTGAALAVTFPSIVITANPKYQPSSITPQLFSSSIHGAQVSDFAFSTSTVSTSTAPVSSSSTISDVIYNMYALGTTTQTCFLSFPNGSSVLSLTPSIATVSPTGVTGYASNGAAQFNVTYSGRTRRTSCPINQSVSTSQTFYSFVASTLASNLYNAATAIIQGQTPSTGNVSIYTSTNDVTHQYTRNTNIFSSTTDLTSIVVYQSAGGKTCDGVLVAPDTVITAAHCVPAVGTSEWFVNNNNVSFSSTVSAVSTISSILDIAVVHLSSQISSTTTGINFAKIFPSNVLQNVSPPSYITNNANLTGYLPMLYTDQFRELHIASWWEWYYDQIGITPPTPSNPYYPWYRQVIGGDSGSAIGALYNGSFVALCTFHGADDCPSISYYAPQINTIMTAQGSPYQLTTVDLSGFPTY